MIKHSFLWYCCDSNMQLYQWSDTLNLLLQSHYFFWMRETFLQLRFRRKKFFFHIYFIKTTKLMVSRKRTCSMDGRRKSGFPTQILQDVYTFNLRFVILLLRVFDKSSFSSFFIFNTLSSSTFWRERERGGDKIFKVKV